MNKKRFIKNKKIDYYNIMISIFIFLLLQLILLPPIFRKTIKLNDDNKSKEKKTILICQGIDKNNNIKVHSSTLYINNLPKQNVITYTKINNDQSIDNIIVTNTINEINFLKNIKGVNLEENKNIITITIHDYIVEKNNSNYLFTKYLDNKKEQKEFYNKNGYKCIEKII